MIDYKNATFKYVKPLGDGGPTMILVSQTGYKISVPLKEGNTDYAEIKKRVDEGTLTIEEAD